MLRKCSQFKYTRAYELQMKTGVFLLHYISLASSTAQIALRI